MDKEEKAERIEKAKQATQKAAELKAKAQAAAAKAAAENQIKGVENPDQKPKGYVPRKKTEYLKQVLPELAKRHGLRNPHEAPKLTCIVVNAGVSEAKDNIQALEEMKRDLAQITGQLPSVRRAKKSISNFKLREGMPIGLMVTLRGDRMWEFFDRLVSVTMPRIRDFRGIDPKAFDGRGNYNLGLKEHHVFSEISIEKSPKGRGMNITFKTTAGQDAPAQELLELMGMPFRKHKKGA